MVFDVGGEALTRLVEEGKLDMSVGGFFKPAPEIRRTPLFRFCLMVIRQDNDPLLRRASATWSGLKGERLVALEPGNIVQDFIDKHLARAGVHIHPHATFNYLDTVIAMVEAGEEISCLAGVPLPTASPVARRTKLSCVGFAGLPCVPRSIGDCFVVDGPKQGNHLQVSDISPVLGTELERKGHLPLPAFPDSGEDSVA